MSKQRNFRTKLSFEDEEEEAPVVARPSKDKKKEREKQKKASLLSFGEEEDAGPSIKKKDSSKPSKFHRPDVQPAAAAAPASTYTQRASAGLYPVMTPPVCTLRVALCNCASPRNCSYEITPAIAPTYHIT